MNYIINSFRQSGYQRDKAVQYALKYALEPNANYKFLGAQRDGGGDCSNFISQCLRAGGAPMAYDSSPWWYKTSGPRKDSWSFSWAVAHSLYWCLKKRESKRLPGIKATEVLDISLLELGDVIQYENAEGRIYHSAIITGFTAEKGEKLPLISQHSFNAANISYVKPAAKKTHFMKIKI